MSDRSRGIRWVGGLAQLVLLAAVVSPTVSAPQTAPQTAPQRAMSADSLWTQLVSPDTLFFAEGLDVDPRTGALYITSIRHGRVMRLDPDGSLHDVLAPTTGAFPAVYGVAVDTARNVLWLTTAAHPQRIPPVTASGANDPAWTESALFRVGLRDGVVQRRWTLGPSPSMPGELALTTRGDVLVSDGTRGLLYRLPPDADTLIEVPHELLRSPQGIAVGVDGRVAWVADWSRGLLRWDLASNTLRAVRTVDVGALQGVDGLRRHGDWLIGIQNGTAPPRVIAARLDAAGDSIVELRELDRAPDHLGEPTVGAVRGQAFVYIVSSQWPFWTETGMRRGDAPLPPVTLRHVPLSLLNSAPPH